MQTIKYAMAVDFWSHCVLFKVKPKAVDSQVTMCKQTIRHSHSLLDLTVFHQKPSSPYVHFSFQKYCIMESNSALG